MIGLKEKENLGTFCVRNNERETMRCMIGKKTYLAASLQSKLNVPLFIIGVSLEQAVKAVAVTRRMNRIGTGIRNMRRL